MTTAQFRKGEFQTPPKLATFMVDLIPKGVITVLEATPTQKPITLYKWLLKKFAKEGDRILDTPLGSGSSAIATRQMGLDFVGCELDTDYYNAAVKRFKLMTAQQQLF